MNLSPQQVQAMSMWQFFAAVDGMTPNEGGLTSAEADDLWKWMQKRDGDRS